MAPSFEALLNGATDEVVELAAALRPLAPAMQRACDLLAQTWDNGGKLLVCGNGGSCADAMHLAEELVVRFQKSRRALAALALADPTVLTCAGNDFGYEAVFERQVEAFGRPGDVLLVMTTSGNSPNILRAIDAARRLGLRTIAFLGRDGGSARGQCDLELIVPAQTAHRVQEGHKILYHTLCEWVDARYGDA
jgi:D-sedoheptulose 7-phosphate isomerase